MTIVYTELNKHCAGARFALLPILFVFRNNNRVDHQAGIRQLEVHLVVKPFTCFSENFVLW
jgi:hypothetical protein